MTPISDRVTAIEESLRWHHRIVYAALTVLLAHAFGLPTEAVGKFIGDTGGWFEWIIR
jgi:hypothetical protein